MDENVETLIEEVEKRPAIYDKNLKDYSNTNVKKHLWEEVCAAVIANWSDLEGENKIKAGLEIQKKWQSLRTCFSRELRNQKRTGQSTKKHRKYIYYEKLLFLYPSVDHRETKKSADDQASESEADTETETEVIRRKVVRPARPTVAAFSWPKAPEPDSGKQRTFEESLLKILQEKKTVDTDEDVNFALSLVPILKSLDEYEKMDAKIQIMTLLKSVKWPEFQ